MYVQFTQPLGSALPNSYRELERCVLAEASQPDIYLFIYVYVYVYI